MKKIILLTTLTVSLSALLMPAFIFAQNEQLKAVTDSLQKTIGPDGAKMINAGEQADNLPNIIGAIIGSLFALLGTVFLVFTLLGGFLWITAGGSEEKVLRAKKFIIGGIEGLIIIFMSYALVYVVLNALSQGANRAAGL